MLCGQNLVRQGLREVLRSGMPLRLWLLPEALLPQPRRSRLLLIKRALWRFLLPLMLGPAR